MATDLFFKYTSFSSALKILATHKFAFRHPRFFNDPFDSRIEEAADFDTELFRTIFYREGQKLIANKSLSPLRVSSADPKLLQIVEECRQEHGLTSEEVFEKFKIKTSDFVESQCSDRSERFSSVEWTCALNEIRVLCLSRGWDSVPMWSHYAEAHSGVVIGVTVPIGEVQKVEYNSGVSEEISPAVYCAKEAFGQNELDPGGIFRGQLATKSVAWKDESEYRIIDRVRNSTADPYFREIGRIEVLYLGCRMDADEKRAIAKLAKLEYPDIEIWECNSIGYRLDHELAVSKYIDR